jgi:hypothetical protein
VSNFSKHAVGRIAERTSIPLRIIEIAVDNGYVVNLGTSAKDPHVDRLLIYRTTR